MMESTERSPQELSLSDYLDVAKRRKWTIIQTLAVVGVIGLVTTAMMTPVYRAESKLLVQAIPAQINAVNTENPLMDLLAMAQPPSVETQIQLLQSQPFLEDVLTKCGIKKNTPQEPGIKVSSVRDTNVITLNVESPNRELAARVANTMLDEYQRQTRMVNLEEIERARKFVEGETKKAHAELLSTEQKLLLFKKNHRVVELTAEQQTRTEELVNLETKTTEVSNNIRRVEAQLAHVKAAAEKEPLERLLPSSKENPRIDALQARLAELEVQRAGLVEEYQENSPRVIALDAQIGRIRNQLAREPKERRIMLHALNPVREEMLGRVKILETELEGLRAAHIQFQSELTHRRQRMNQLGPWEIQLAQLTRTRDTAEKQYLMLTSRLNDLRIRENARRSTARIIERATPPIDPVRPRKAVNLAVALLAGIFLGFCLAFLQEYLDDRITSPDEADRLVRLPVLGHIPLMAGDSHRLMSELPTHSPIAESYRALRTSISFASIDAPLRTILVTSAHKGEGKSTTSINLAIAMAMEGRQVILVDADMRRPSLHRALDLPSAPGLTDVLLGNKPVSEALKKTEVEGLRVLTSGPIPPNPAELLNSGPMTSLIAELKEMADIVIFDTPPCLPVTDAQVLAAKVEGVLLVAEIGEAKKAEVKHAKELFDRAHARTVGMIFNKISEASGSYYYYYYYRRQGYGYEPEEAEAKARARALPRVGAATGSGRSEKDEA